MEKIDENRWEEVISYLPLIKKMARAYSGELLEYDDLVQEGCFVVYDCLSKYDSNKSSKSTYLSNMIRYRYYSILTCSRFSFSVPDIMCKYAFRLHRLEQKNRVLTGNFLTTEEMQEKLKQPLKTIKNLDILNRRMTRSQVTHLEEYNYENEEMVDKIDSENDFSDRFIDFVPCDINAEEEAINLTILEDTMDKLGTLTEKQRQSVLYYLGFITGKKETYQRTGDFIGCSYQNAAKNYNKGIKQLRKSVLGE